MNEYIQAIEKLVRTLEALEKEKDPSYGWAEAGLLVTLRKAWATYEYEKMMNNDPRH